MSAEEKTRVWTSGRILFGICLSLAFCFLVVSVVTYSPLDPPGQTYAALERPVHNLCGPSGAYCADLLYRLCGYGVWFLLIPLFLRLVSFWRLPRLKGSALKVIGTFLMLTALCGALSAFVPYYRTKTSDSAKISEPASTRQADTASEPASGGAAAFRARLASQQTELGPGGQLGVVARFLLDKKLHLAPIGIGIFLVFMFAAGVILASDSPLLHLLLQVTGLRAAAEVFVRPEKRKNVPPEPEPAPTPPPGEPAEPVGEEEETGGVEEDAPGEEEEPDEEDAERPAPYVLPPIGILPYGDPVDTTGFQRRIEKEMARLQKAFDDYNCDVRVVGYQTGPVITLFELELSKGQKLAQLRNLENELAIAMKVPNVRVVFPIPGKSSVGVEVPNKDRQYVRLRDVMEESAEMAETMQIPLFIGKDIAGDPVVADLAKLPHLLIAGRTGTGKSVCLNSIILSILMTKTPAQVRLMMIDPKMVELSPYKKIPHLMHHVMTDMKEATRVLSWLCDHMDERYNLLARVGVRQLKEYNRLTPKKLYQRYQPQSEEEWERVPKQLSAIVVIADEIADMMAIAGKEVSEHIARLAAKSRAVGIHLILATQKPTVNVVTGLIKSNLPARIAFGVATQNDSRVILDENGAEKLLGNGDFLFLDSVTNRILRGQGTFIDSDEIYSVNCEIAVDKPEFVKIDIEGETREIQVKQRSDDPLYEQAVEMILTERRGSTSLLQRRFSIGYGRAAKIIDAMEAEGLIGPKTENDSKPRKVLKSLEQWRAERQSEENTPSPIPRATLPPAEPIKQTSIFFEAGGDEPDEEERPRPRRIYARPESAASAGGEEPREEDGAEDEYDDESDGGEYEDGENVYDREENEVDEYEDDGEPREEDDAETYAEDEYGGESDDGEFEDEEYEDEEYEDDGEPWDEDGSEAYAEDGSDGEEYGGDEDGSEAYAADEWEEEPETDEPIEEEPFEEPVERPRPNLRDLARRRRERKRRRRQRGEDV